MYTKLEKNVRVEIDFFPHVQETFGKKFRSVRDGEVTASDAARLNLKAGPFPSRIGHDAFTNLFLSRVE